MGLYIFIIAIILIPILAIFLLYKAGIFGDVFNFFLKKIDIEKIQMKTTKSKSTSTANKSVTSTNKHAEKTAGMVVEEINPDERTYLIKGIRDRQKLPCFNCKKADFRKIEDETNTVSVWRCDVCGQHIKLIIKNNGSDFTAIKYNPEAYNPFH